MEKSSSLHKYSFQLSIILIIGNMFMLLYNDFINSSFWYDEAYTIVMIKYPLSEIWNITAIDVHPPLYYFMLKIFSEIFGNDIYILRIFSALGVMVAFLLGLYPVRRLFGKEISFLFILLLAILPITQYLGVEIRMYSWAMFFVLGCSVYAYEANDTNRLAPYIKMTVLGIFSMYTHYYALVATGGIFLFLWLSALKKRKKATTLVVSTIILILAYIPWIPELIQQLSRAGEESWIKVPNAKEMLLFCYYFFSPKEPSHPYMIFSLPVMSVALSVMLLLIGIIIYCIVKLHFRKIKTNISKGHIFVGIALFTLLVTFTITFLIKPISIPRYTTCILGPLILGFSIYLVELSKGKTKPLVYLSVIVISILGIARFFSERDYYKMKNEELIQINTLFEKKDRKPDIIVANLSSYPVLAGIQILFPEKEYILYSPNDKTNYLPFKIQTINHIPDLPEFIFVEWSSDSTDIYSTYRIIEELKLEQYNIMLLKNNK